MYINVETVDSRGKRIKMLSETGKMRTILREISQELSISIDFSQNQVLIMQIRIIAAQQFNLFILDVGKRGAKPGVQLRDHYTRNPV